MICTHAGARQDVQGCQRHRKARCQRHASQNTAACIALSPLSPRWPWACAAWRPRRRPSCTATSKPPTSTWTTRRALGLDRLGCPGNPCTLAITSHGSAPGQQGTAVSACQTTHTHPHGRPRLLLLRRAWHGWVTSGSAGGCWTRLGRPSRARRAHTCTWRPRSCGAPCHKQSAIMCHVLSVICKDCKKAARAVRGHGARGRAVRPRRGSQSTRERQQHASEQSLGQRQQSCIERLSSGCCSGRLGTKQTSPRASVRVAAAACSASITRLRATLPGHGQTSPQSQPRVCVSSVPVTSCTTQRPTCGAGACCCPSASVSDRAAKWNGRAAGGACTAGAALVHGRQPHGLPVSFGTPAARWKGAVGLLSTFRRHVRHVPCPPNGPPARSVRAAVRPHLPDAGAGACVDARAMPASCRLPST
jgi:hypothetical protein